MGQRYRKVALTDYATQIAQEEGVDPALVRAVMQRESAGRPDARSPKGAYGPMQLMPGTAAELGVNRDIPQENIRGGVRYLKQQIRKFGGDREKALAAYNAGPGAVQRFGGVPPYPETREYVQAIMGTLGSPQDATQAPATAPIATPRYRKVSPEDAARQGGPKPTQLPSLPIPGTKKLAASTPPPPGSWSAYPPQLEIGATAMDVLSGFNPLTPTGRENIGGAVGSAVATIPAAATLNVPLAAVAGVAGATTGGAVAGAVNRVIERVTSPTPPPPPTAGEFLDPAARAGGEQAAGELVGTGTGIGLGVLKGAGRKIAGPLVKKYTGQRFTTQHAALQTDYTLAAQVEKEAKEGIQRRAAAERAAFLREEHAFRGEDAADALAKQGELEALSKEVEAIRQAGVSPGQAGAQARQTLRGFGPMPLRKEIGPVRAVLDARGKAVTRTAAETTDPVDLTELIPLIEQLEGQKAGARTSFPLKLGKDATPADASDYSPAAQAAIAASGATDAPATPPLLANHPVLGVLTRVKNAIAQGGGAVPFLDAHQYKRELYDAVNFDKNAKEQVEQMTKAVALKLRETMRGISPDYDAANAAYEELRYLVDTDTIGGFLEVAQEQPEALVRGLKVTQPTRLGLVKEVLTQYGGAEGQAAWRNVEDAWITEHLIEGDLKALGKRLTGVEYGDGLLFVRHFSPEAHAQIRRLREIEAASHQIEDTYALRQQQRGQQRLVVDEEQIRIGERAQAAEDALALPGKPTDTVRQATAALNDLKGKQLAFHLAFGDTMTVPASVGAAAMATTLQGGAWKYIAMARLALTGPKRTALLEYASKDDTVTNFLVQVSAHPMSPLTLLMVPNVLRSRNFQDWIRESAPAGTVDLGPPSR